MINYLKDLFIYGKNYNIGNFGEFWEFWGQAKTNSWTMLL